MTDLSTYYDRNNNYATAFSDGDLPMRPRYSTIILTCTDARIDPAHFLGITPGDALVMRNAGGRVTPEVIQELAILQVMADQMSNGTVTLSLAVIHHGDCGMERLASSSVRQMIHQRSGIDSKTLESLAIFDHALSLQNDVDKLRNSGLIRPEMVVSGHFYDVNSGRLRQELPPSPVGKAA